MNANSSLTGLGQLVLRGYKRRVQGSNGLNSAQLSRPRGSTQTPPSRHRLRRDGHVVIEAWAIAHIPGLVSREDRTQLPSEKGHNGKTRMNREQEIEKRQQEIERGQDVLPRAFEHRVSVYTRKVTGMHCTTNLCCTTGTDTIGTTITTTTADKGYNYSHPLAKRQPEEFYCMVRHASLANPDMKLGRRQRCLGKHAIVGWVPSRHGATRCRRETASSEWQTRKEKKWARRELGTTTITTYYTALLHGGRCRPSYGPS